MSRRTRGDPQPTLDPPAKPAPDPGAPPQPVAQPSLRILSAPEELAAADRPVCVAIGVFDGVHLGHQAVVGELVAEARRQGAVPVVVTFDRHPNAVVAPASIPPLLQSLPQRIRALAALGPEAAWVIRFDERFSRQHGDEFVRRLASGFAPLRAVYVGAQFQFGRRRSGNVALLERLGEELGFRVQAVRPVDWQGQAVSSTRIREAVRAGDLALARHLLGRDYELAGRVQPGDRLGHQLGFPTANLEVGGRVLPPNGVYAAWALTDDQRHHRAVVNIGTRPTLSNLGSAVRVEAHLLDYAGELYGRELEVRLVGQVRDERRFPSLAALAQQIGQDVGTARRLLAGQSGAAAGGARDGSSSLSTASRVCARSLSL
ncbi:MAG: riboflavin biosynthesis protein RibF [Verrucomicrobia bacterium]|nr:riboflavin biosynthesis protein RibF [Verrucomicrobiota bacterium]